MVWRQIAIALIKLIQRETRVYCNAHIVEYFVTLQNERNYFDKTKSPMKTGFSGTHISADSNQCTLYL